MTRRQLLRQSALAGGVLLFPEALRDLWKPGRKLGVQLHTFRKEMDADARMTLQKIAAIGIKEIESARSPKGNYYGLSAREMRVACKDLGMKLVSGHVHLDEQWQQSIDEAAESGQEYLICSTMPTDGQTIDNYKKVADQFNQVGEECKKIGLHFGYHNHTYEFESDQGQVLYDVLLTHTQPDLVHMELDLGWVIVGGKDPLDYFQKFPGRFPLWHLKDIDITKKESTEFGKGGLNIVQMQSHLKASGAQHIFIEQEAYARTPLESMKENLDYLRKL